MAVGPGEIQRRLCCLTFGVCMTLKGKKRFAFLLTAFPASMDLMLQSDLCLLVDKTTFNSRVLALIHLFHIHLFFLFPFPSFFLLAGLPFFLPFLSPFLPPSLPSFLYFINIREMPRVCVNDGNTIKEVLWEQIHQLEFMRNRWSPSKKFKHTACFSFG